MSNLGCHVSLQMRLERVFKIKMKSKKTVGDFHRDCEGDSPLVRRFASPKVR
jgi:hypothetical protein